MSEIIYGVRGIDGKTICIDEVPYDKPGLLCDCTCAYCGRNLQACSLNGKVSPYFRHHTEKRDGSHYRSKFICNPNIANETALHKMAKQIISEEKRICVPEKYISLFEVGIKNLPNNIVSNIKDYRLHDEMEVVAESVDIEKTIGDFTPDVAFNTKRGTILVEIYVTHKVDDEKKFKVIDQGVSMLEIDLSQYVETSISSESLRKILIEEAENKTWIYYYLSDNIKVKVLQYFENLEVIKKYRKKCDDKKFANEKLIKLFERGEYADALNKLVDDVRFLDFYKNNCKFHWFNFGEAFEENNEVPFYINIPICGEMIFKCDRRIWQSIIFNRFIYGRKNNEAKINLNNLFDDLKNDYGINIDYTLTYKFTNPLDENETIWLPYDVIYKYMEYLEQLGFIYTKNYRDELSGWRTVRLINTIDPPNTTFAHWLKSALNEVDVLSPRINELIEEKIFEYQAIELRKEEDKSKKDQADIYLKELEKQQEIQNNSDIPEPEIGMRLFHQQYGNLRIISIEKRTDKTIIVVEDSDGAISNKTWEVLWKNNLIIIIDKRSF